LHDFENIDAVGEKETAVKKLDLKRQAFAAP